MIRKRLTSMLSALALVLSLFTLLPEGALKAQAAVTEYNLWIGGIRVTSENKSDVAGFVYDPSTNTLSTNGKSIGTIFHMSSGIENRISGLTIKFDIDFELGTKKGSAIICYADTTITGPSKGTIYSTDEAGILVEGATLTIENVNLDVEGKWAIAGMPSNEKLVIKNSTVTARTTASKYAIGEFKKGITVTDCTISTPSGGKVSLVNVDGTESYYICKSNGTTFASEVKISREYPLVVSGRRVTDDNAADIMGRGNKEAVYDKNRKTLEINGSLNSTDYEAIYNEGIDGLKINVSKNVTLSSTNKNAIKCAAMTIISGSGKLIASSVKGCGIFVHKGARLEIVNGNVAASGQFGISGAPNGESIYIDNSTVTAKGTSFALGDFNGGIYLYKCYVNKPSSATFVNYTCCNPGGTKATLVNIVPGEPEEYGFSVTGVQVTSANCGDILGKGKKEAVYDPSTKTLELNGNITCSDSFNVIGIGNYMTGLTIKVNKDITLESTTENYCVIRSFNDFTITGSGKLTLKSKSRAIIAEGSNVTVTNANINTLGSGGLLGRTYNGVKSKLIVNNSAITVNATDSNSAVFNFLNGIELNNCYIETPSNYVISNGTVCESNGTTYAKNVVIKPGTLVKYDLNIAGVQVTSKNCADILGKGKKEAVYDPSTKTLELNGNITYNGCVLGNDIPGLTIKVNKDITLESTSSNTNTIQSFEDFTITGSGKLTVKAVSYNIGVSFSTVTIKDADIDLVGSGFEGSDYDGRGSRIIFDNSSVTISSTNNHVAVWFFPKGIELNNCYIETPSNYVISNGAVYESNGTTYARNVVIKPGYDLYVAGVQVTGKNCADILGNGNKEAVYDPSTNTLELNKDINTTDDHVIYNNMNGLTIKVNNDVTISSFYPFYPVFLKSDTTITGPGKLTAISESGCGIYIETGKLTIKDADVDVTGRWGIAGLPNKESLLIDNSTVKASGTDYAMGDFTYGIELKNCCIETPSNYVISNGSVYESNGTTEAKEVKIRPVETYDLKVAGVQVTEKNCTDILGNGNKEAVYDPVTNTLELNKDIDSSSITVIDSEINGLTIKVNNDVTLKSDYDGMKLYADTTITGPGKLTVISKEWCGIYFYNSELTIKDAYIDVSGSWGIVGDPNHEKLTIDNSTVIAKGKTGSITDIGKEIELINCDIMAPEGALIYKVDNGYGESWSVCDSNYETITDTVRISNKKWLIGDVNHDGSVDRIDANLLSRYVAGWDGYEEKIFKDCADLNDDHEINRIDANILSRCVADWDGYREKYIK